MKLIIVLVVLAALVSSSLTLKNAICGQASSVTGQCLAAFLKWSYNSRKNVCVPFVYGGCGGNENRFYSLEDCRDTCVELRKP